VILKNGDVTHENGDVTNENGDGTNEHGDLPTWVCPKIVGSP
jgi:hypothetical protein